MKSFLNKALLSTVVYFFVLKLFDEGGNEVLEKSIRGARTEKG